MAILKLYVPTDIVVYVKFDKDRASGEKYTRLRQGKKERSRGKDRFQLNTLCHILAMLHGGLFPGFGISNRDI